MPVNFIIMGVMIVIALAACFAPRLKKKQYEGQDMAITTDWYEQSQSKYSDDETKKAYFFSFDKNYIAQGHYMVDRNKNTIYEAKILYGDAVTGFETDIINHLINYKSHHKMGSVTNYGVGSDRVGTAVSSSFKFDGVSIWEYLEKLGYDYQFEVHGLAYQINVTKNGVPCGTIYSSNNGKNYFDCEGPIVAKMGGKGLLVVECADKDIDGMFLMAMAFAKTELSLENMSHK